jgi:hypothetical protein
MLEMLRSPREFLQLLALLSSFNLNTSVNKLFLLRLLCLLLLYTSFSIVLNSSVCDLCHLVSPKVVGICTFTSCEGSVFPFLQSAFASSKHTGSVCAIITLVISNLSGSKGLTKDSNSLASAQLSGAPSNINFAKMLYMRMNESVPSRLTCVL